MRCAARHNPFFLRHSQTRKELLVPISKPNVSGFGRRKQFSSTRHLNGDIKENETPREDPDHQHEHVQDATLSPLRPSQLLPRSPIAKNYLKHRERNRKPRPTQQDLERLSNNPWAVALASPTRACAVTQVRHPSALLGAWSLVQRPETDTLWMMPLDLLKDELQQATPLVKQRYGSETVETHNVAKTKETKIQPFEYLKSRLINRWALLKEMTRIFTTSTSRNNARMAKIIPHRWRLPKGPLTPRDIRNIVWREDMPEFVLENMGKEVARTLGTYLRSDKMVDGDEQAIVSLTGNPELTPVDAIHKMDMTENMRCGAVLIMRGDSSSTLISRAKESAPSSNPNFANTGDSEKQPDHLGSEQTTVEEPITIIEEKVSDRVLADSLDYLTLPQTGSKVPVFNLSALLSPQHLEQIRSLHPRFCDDAIFFLPKGKRGIDAMLALWRLKSTVMHDRPFLGEGRS